MKIIALILLGCTIWFTLFFLPFFYVEKRESGSSLYGFPMNLFGDYYSYVYFIKSGLQGKLYFENVFTDEKQPIQFTEPHYFLFGLLFAPFNKNAHELFMLLRIIAPTICLICFIYVVSKIISDWLLQLFALLIFIFSTAFWWVHIPSPDVWSDMFHITRKILNLPPHYFFAISLTILLILHSTRMTYRLRSFFWGILLIGNLTWMHPYIAIFTISYIVASSCVEMILKRKVNKIVLLHLVILVSSMLLIIGYYQYLLSFVWKSPTQQNIAIASLPIGKYLLSLGPVFLFSLPTILYFPNWKHPLKLRLILWGILPIFFFLSNLLGIPISPIRVYQTYQHLPLSILTTISVISLIKRFPVSIQKLTIISLSILLILYALPEYTRGFDYAVSESQPYFRWKHDIDIAQGTFDFLRKNAKKDWLIIAPDPVSSFFPAFTDTKVIIGLEGINVHHAYNKHQIDMLYSGILSKEQLQTFLKEYRVDYVIFGIESPIYDSLPYKNFDVFSIAYKDSQVTVVTPTNI
jgi:hypothetical protein